MAKFTLAARAEFDLTEIYAYSFRAFGEYQAEAYAAGLVRTFGLLADFPGIGTSSDELCRGLRCFRFQSHYVYYTVEIGEVMIRAILHVRRLPRRDLFE